MKSKCLARDTFVEKKDQMAVNNRRDKSMKRSKDDIDKLESIIGKAEEGLTVETDNENDAINLRQKIYGYKRHLMGKDDPRKELLDRLKVSVQGTTVHINTRLSDYMSNIQV